jgi:23S rRNA (cytidine2498-2'-O)-methyltransferase
MSLDMPESLEALEAGSYQLILSMDPDFTDLAADELRRADRKADVARELAPGLLLVNSSIGFGKLAEQWRDTPPIFVRHICPVQVIVPWEGDAATLDALEYAVNGELVPALDPTLPISVQTRVPGHLPLRPFQVNERLASSFADQGIPVDVRAPQQVLSVVAVEAGAGTGAVYAGASYTAHNLSDWAGGMRRFAREEGQVSRSEFKLLEAIEVFGLELPPRGTALDLGASPGGWTRILRMHEQYVTAVDPGELDARLASDRGIRHKRMTAEAYLAGEPDTFDIIVNDMRMDGRDSARLMVGYARCLYPHGWALMTLKLPETKREIVLDHGFSLLRRAYTIEGARHLFHNRSEITLWLRPIPQHHT